MLSELRFTLSTVSNTSTAKSFCCVAELYRFAGYVTNPSTFEHVTEEFFHGSVADRAAEEEALDSVGRDVAQSRHGKQEAPKPALKKQTCSNS